MGPDAHESPSIPRWRLWGRRLALIPLLAYTGVLAFGAIPISLRFSDGMDKAVRKVRKTFYKVRIKPGSAVFHGLRKHDLIERKSCLFVVGIDENQQVQVLHETFPRCQYPNVRVFNDHYNLMLFHYIGVGRIDEISSSRGEARFRAVKKLQTWKHLDKLSGHFCERYGVAQVFIGADTSSALYKTGDTTENATVFHGWNCGAGARVPTRHLNVTVDEGYPLYTYEPT